AGVSTVTVYNLASNLASAQNNIRGNDPYLDTTYKGVEFTASKRFSSRWQMVAGFTVGENRGGVAQGTDLNDPNNTTFPHGIIGNDSKYAFRLSGTYRLPFDIGLAGSVVSNTGYPVVSTFAVTQALASNAAGVTLTRA